MWSYDDGQAGSPRLYHYLTQLLEFGSLEARRQLDVPYDPRWMVISPDGGRAFVGANHPRLFGALLDLDLETGLQSGRASVSSTSGLGAAFAPLPPRPDAVISGQDVTLSWTLPDHSPAALGYAIHVGSRSGLTDVGVVEVGNASSIAVATVPPGRYFLRLTATNATGTSSPSAEVVIDIAPHRKSGAPIESAPVGVRPRKR
jgi:hypothetical protein